MRLFFASRPFCQVYAYKATANPRVFLTLAKGEEEIGRMEFELYENKAPLTVANFRALVSGENTIGKSFSGTPFHRIIDGFIA